MVGCGKDPKRVKRMASVSIAAASISGKSLRKLARQGGIVRLSKNEIDNARDNLVKYLKGIIRDSVYFTIRANRNIVSEEDILSGLKKNGVTFDGF